MLFRPVLETGFLSNTVLQSIFPTRLHNGVSYVLARNKTIVTKCNIFGRVTHELSGDMTHDPNSFKIFQRFNSLDTV